MALPLLYEPLCWSEETRCEEDVDFLYWFVSSLSALIGLLVGTAVLLRIYFHLESFERLMIRMSNDWVFPQSKARIFIFVSMWFFDFVLFLLGVQKMFVCSEMPNWMITLFSMLLNFLLLCVLLWKIVYAVSVYFLVKGDIVSIYVTTLVPILFAVFLTVLDLSVSCSKPEIISTQTSFLHFGHNISLLHNSIYIVLVIVVFVIQCVILRKSENRVQDLLSSLSTGGFSIYDRDCDDSVGEKYWLLNISVVLIWTPYLLSTILSFTSNIILIHAYSHDHESKIRIDGYLQKFYIAFAYMSAVLLPLQLIWDTLLYNNPAIRPTTEYDYCELLRYSPISDVSTESEEEEEVTELTKLLE